MYLVKFNEKTFAKYSVGTIGYFIEQNEYYIVRSKNWWCKFHNVME
jgi:hypothetical protein